MQIGIAPVLAGGKGVYQYSMTMVQALGERHADGCDDQFTVFAEDVSHPNAIALSQRGWTVRSIHPPSPGPKVLNRQALGWLRHAAGEGTHRDAWRSLKRQLRRMPSLNGGGLRDPEVVRYRSDAKRWLDHCGIELMLYPVQRPLAFEARIPYVMAIHDVQHRLQPEFPEVSANGEWGLREYCLRNGTRYATLLLADSEVGKEDILNFYGAYSLTPDRVKVLPFLPACYLTAQVSEDERLRVRATYQLPERYLFYPAQFWPHKNHARIVRALGLLKQEHRLKASVVFCGSHTGEIRHRTFREVMTLSRQLGLADQVRFLGYVADEDMSGLYAEAAALVMPTFFGPTNIPLLEAWAFGCPALTSDVRGIREQVGDAAILVDPRSVEAIAHGIHRLWTDSNLRDSLAELGRRRMAGYTPDDYRRRLAGILEEGKARVRSEAPRHAT